jgi:hypothetical protein
MLATSIYFILKICDTCLSLGSHRTNALEMEKLISHNYKEFDDKEILTKDIKPLLSCTEHLILRGKSMLQ